MRVPLVTRVCGFRVWGILLRGLGLGITGLAWAWTPNNLRSQGRRIIRKS